MSLFKGLREEHVFGDRQLSLVTNGRSYTLSDLYPYGNISGLHRGDYDRMATQLSKKNVWNVSERGSVKAIT